MSEYLDKYKLSKKATNMIILRDSKCSVFKISERLCELFENNTVTIGYRIMCGSKSDFSAKYLQMFREVVKVLNKDGFEITEENGEKQKNAYATNNGGFWNEITFKLKVIK